ncbi:CBS domain-containing protein [Paenibacillus glycanilyticus]|uniref:CBS domain-containing protein n=1 Tax=Paenibacillus glycanilyticus TaxID=126569 RepID=UPI00158102D3|nr:CBS domain-containing protein [Paenibacillus glycanilyticus]
MRKMIKEVMSSPCITATLLDNVYELAVLMKKHDIGFIPIVDGSKLIGAVTDRDLVVRGYADKHSGSTAVEKVMTTDLLTIAPDTTMEEAADLMAKHKIRRLPVVENGQLVGVVAIGDLAVRDAFIHEAGAALNEISEHVH